MDDTDLITVPSHVGPKTTMSRLVSAVRARGLTIFARIDHAAGAAEVGLSLRPTDLLIFGAAKAGTPLMQAQQLLGVDLPLRALVWTDEAGETFVTRVSPLAIARRRGVGEALAAQVAQMEEGLAAIVAEAIGPLRADEELDEALEESFPASDPPELGGYV